MKQLLSWKRHLLFFSLFHLHLNAQPEVSNDYVPAFLMGGSAALLFAFSLDEDIQNLRGPDLFSPQLDRYIQPFGSYYTLGFSIGFYGYSLIAKDQRAAQTSISLGRAVAFSLVGAYSLKYAFRRNGPLSSQEEGMKWFEYDKPRGESNFFPSGHATYITSVATVLSLSYPEKGWIPWVTYGLAGAVSFERVYNGRHHLSDVVAGIILGHFIGRLAVKPWKIDTYFIPSGVGLSIDLD